MKLSENFIMVSKQVIHLYYDIRNRLLIGFPIRILENILRNLWILWEFVWLLIGAIPARMPIALFTGLYPVLTLLATNDTGNDTSLSISANLLGISVEMMALLTTVGAILIAFSKREIVTAFLCLPMILILYSTAVIGVRNPALQSSINVIMLYVGTVFIMALKILRIQWELKLERQVNVDKHSYARNTARG